MRVERKLAISLIILMGIASVFCAGSADAKQDGRRGGPGGQRAEMNRPIHGEILSISETEIVIAPSIPEEILEKMAERGMEPPADLPDEITVSLAERTKYFINGEKAEAGVFSAGDTVVIGVRKGKDGPVAIVVADLETAKEFLTKRIGGHGGGPGGQGEGPGWGGPGDEGSEFGFGPGDGKSHRRGPGGQDRGQGQQGRGRPFFGEIISIDEYSITIKPEVPEFILERMSENGVMPKMNLPEELTLGIDSETVYVVDGEMQEDNPFAAGDKVAIKMKGTRNDPVAVGIADYATAEKMASEKGGGPGGNRGSRGPRRHQR